MQCFNRPVFIYLHSDKASVDVTDIERMKRMRKMKVIALILLVVGFVGMFFLLPIKQAFIFTETRTDKETIFYMPMDKTNAFEIRYVHSIHLTDVIEFYEVTTDRKIRLLSMTYENLAIGLPGYAGEGETFSVEDGVYTLTYNDRVLDSFTMLIGNVDAELTFRYGGAEVNLKETLTKGKSYAFAVSKLSYYEMLKGVRLHAER